VPPILRQPHGIAPTDQIQQGRPELHRIGDKHCGQTASRPALGSAAEILVDVAPPLACRWLRGTLPDDPANSASATAPKPIRAD
jgi:hypothetical protein